MGLLRDIRKLFWGMNKDADPSLVQQGEFTDALNVRVASSEQQHGVGVMETMQGEVEILIDVEAPIYYGGQAIGGDFIYTGYPEVQIGNQVWMKKNWDFNFPGSKVYNNDEANAAIYGRLYNWAQIHKPDFCPQGWHLPVESEIDELLEYLGGAIIAGGRMKEPDDLHWNLPNTGADDFSGFKGLPGGMFDTIFKLLGQYGRFWINTEAGTGALKDKDGNIYTTVIIGSQQWIIENLRTTRYRDNTLIPNLTADGDWIADAIGAYCWYDNDIGNRDVYGALYNWHSVNNPRGLAYFERGGVMEEGWRIPSVADWNTLFTTIGGLAVAGGRLKEVGTTHWLPPNIGATDEYGFRGRGAGQRWYDTGAFTLLMMDLQFWASNEASETEAPIFDIFYGDIVVDYNPGVNKNFGFSVRCVRDI